MPTTIPEQLILNRYREKCSMAGGARAGFVLRRRAILYIQPAHPDVDLDGGIESLLERKLLATSESGDFLFLTATGVEALAQLGSDASP